MASTQQYEVVIIGGGPAGLTAGLYVSRARLKSLLIERAFMGGQIVNAEQVENFPGFPAGLSGMQLGELMHEQSTKYGLETVMAEATKLDLVGGKKLVKTEQGVITAQAVILAGGSQRLKLGVPGEAEFTGKGVSYCATCDAAFFRDVPVAVVGGGDAAIGEALHLTKFASRVFVIHRRHELRAARILEERAKAEPKIEFLWDTTVERVEGNGFVSRALLYNSATSSQSTLPLAGIFISVGFKPDTEFLKGTLPLNSGGYVVTNVRMETSVPGVLAAGDIRFNSARQAITAAGDGATAAIYAQKFLTES